MFFSFLHSAPLSFFVFAAGLFGLCVGSFLNVVIYRLPQILENEWRADCQEYFKDFLKPEAFKESDAVFSLSFPRSFCPSCGHKISAIENIPVISFLFLKGKCKACGKKISWRYPVIELLTGILSAFAIFTLGATLQGCAALILLWVLIALTFIDFDHQLLPDSLTLPLLWIGLLINLCPNEGFIDIQQAVIGAVAGYLSLWSIYWLFKILTHKEGMGYGDFKLLAALGAWFGWKMLLPIVLFASAVGAIVGIILIFAAKHGKNVPIPFGPYLAGGGLLALFWGKDFLALFFPTFL